MEHGDTSEDLSDLGAGVYSVVVTDENGCSVSIEVEITESDAMTISSTNSDYTGYGVSCNGASDGFIDVTVTGGTGVYTYAWTADWNVDPYMNASFSDTDCNGNAFPEWWIGDGICDDGQYTYEGTIIYLDCPEFGYDGGDCPIPTQDLSNLTSGTYTVVATDENGCSVTTTVEITEAEEMAITETHSDYTGYGVSCNGATDGSIDVTVTGGTGVYTYQWSNGATTEDVADLGAGVYTVFVTDENGCSVSIEVEITESEEMQITETHSDYTGYGVSCNGATDGSIDVTVTGGTGVYTYAWSNGATTEDIADLGAGVYSVVVTDENGCSVSIEVEITETEAMAISSTNSDYTGYGVSCNGASDGFIDVTVTGGTGVYTYQWSLEGASFSRTDCNGNAVPEWWMGRWYL